MSLAVYATLLAALAWWTVRRHDRMYAASRRRTAEAIGAHRAWIEKRLREDAEWLASLPPDLFDATRADFYPGGPAADAPAGSKASA